MEFHWPLTTLIFFADLVIRIGFSLRVVMSKRAQPTTLAWLVVILVLPFAGAILYLLFGETRLGDRRAERAAAGLDSYKRWISTLKIRSNVVWQDLNPVCRLLHRQADALTGIPTLPGNSLQLLDEAENALQHIIKDIDQAKSSCHLEFYIWHKGGTADEVAEALIRAGKRGVKCRILLDSVGSDHFLKSSMALKMKRHGVEIAEALRAGLVRALLIRIDLRNHRKLVVIDGTIAYTGSLNMIDPRYFKQDTGLGQWVDTLVRVQGPVVEAMGGTFLADWIVESGTDIHSISGLADVHPVAETGKAAVQLVPSGPGFAPDIIHNLLLSTIFAARKELILTTPYFVPDQIILSALKAAAVRGVHVTIIVPKKVDSKLVQLASWARYEELVRVGVDIMLFHDGLLHSKTITVDSEFSLIGSVNLDMRSFWLNFEATLFVYNREFTENLRATQQGYILGSSPLDRLAMRHRGFFNRLLENTALLIGPLL